LQNIKEERIERKGKGKQEDKEERATYIYGTSDTT
jgi:hypothetical protein